METYHNVSTFTRLWLSATLHSHSLIEPSSVQSRVRRLQSTLSHTLLLVTGLTLSAQSVLTWCAVSGSRPRPLLTQLDQSSTAQSTGAHNREIFLKNIIITQQILTVVISDEASYLSQEHEECFIMLSL